MADVTGTTAAVYIEQKWTQDVQKPFYKAQVFAKLVTRRDNLVSDGGSTINVPFLSTYNARAKTAGTGVTFDANTETQIQVSINKHYYSALLIEDFAAVQASYDLQSIYQGAQTEAVTRQMDFDIASLYTGAGTTVAAGTTATDANMISVMAALDAANVPQDNRYGAIGYGTKSDFMNINKYVAYDQTGRTGVAIDADTNNPAFISQVYGFDLFMTNNLVTTGGSGYDLFFHKSGISLAVQMKPTYHVEYSVSDLGTKVALEAVYGVQVERSNAVVALSRTTNP